MDLEKEVLVSLNDELKTNLTIKDIKDKKVQLFVDSFDEGLVVKDQKETLVKKYFEKLGNPKLLISCNSDFLTETSNDKWFEPESKKLEKSFITPLGYNKSFQIKDQIKIYLE